MFLLFINIISINAKDSQSILIYPTTYFSQVDDESNEVEDEYSDIPKGLIGEIGLGWNGLALAGGLRYWIFGVSMGLNGVANGMPNYAQYIPNLNLSYNDPLPSGYTEEKYVGVIVTGDFITYLGDVGNFELNASVGYYSQADSILARNIQTGDRVKWKTEVHSGITFGLGLEYPFKEIYSIGLLAHTKRGIGIRFTYIWY